MGMYTELHIGVEFKKETPPDVIAAIRWMATGEGDRPESSHALFATQRVDWMLRSGGSYYFDAKPCLVWMLDSVTNTWSLTVTTNIKNYTQEWESFLDFIAPHLSTEGFLGHLRYEESDDPTLLYNNGGVIEWRRVAPTPGEETP